MVIVFPRIKSDPVQNLRNPDRRWLSHSLRYVVTYCLMSFPWSFMVDGKARALVIFLPPGCKFSYTASVSSSSLLKGPSMDAHCSMTYAGCWISFLWANSRGFPQSFSVLAFSCNYDLVIFPAIPPCWCYWNLIYRIQRPLVQILGYIWESSQGDHS